MGKGALNIPPTIENAENRHNAIGDADLCRPALVAAQAIVARSGAPVLNGPAAVLATGRDGS